MSKPRRPWSDHVSASATGWISMSDVFLLSTVFMIAAVLGLGVAHQKEKRRADDTEAARTDIENELNEARAAHAKALADMAKKKADVGAAWERSASRETELSARIAFLESQIAEMEEAAEEAARAAEREREKLLARARAAESDRDALKESIAALEATIADLESNAIDDEAAKTLIAKLRGELADARATNEKRRLEEGRLRQELLAIKGSLDRVIFVFDRSGSMAEDNRWEQVKKTAADWVELLPVNEAALITFNDTLTVFPDDGSLLDMKDVENRERLVTTLGAVKPERGTNTLLALQSALAYEKVDAIVLLTDGRPTVSPIEGTQKGEFIPQVRDYVQQQVNDGSTVRIHTIGLADYFGSDFGKLLLDISELTKGTFIGR